MLLCSSVKLYINIETTNTKKEDQTKVAHSTIPYILQKSWLFLLVATTEHFKPVIYLFIFSILPSPSYLGIAFPRHSAIFPHPSSFLFSIHGVILSALGYLSTLLIHLFIFYLFLNVFF